MSVGVVLIVLPCIARYAAPSVCAFVPSVALLVNCASAACLLIAFNHRVHMLLSLLGGFSGLLIYCFIVLHRVLLCWYLFWGVLLGSSGFDDGTY